MRVQFKKPSLLETVAAVLLLAGLALGASQSPVMAQGGCSGCPGGSQLCCTNTYCDDWICVVMVDGVCTMYACQQWITRYHYQNPPPPPPGGECPPEGCVPE